MAKNEPVQLKAQLEKGKGKIEGAVLLTLQGELTIDNAAAVRKYLLDSLAKHKKFTVRISNVENIDLTIIQLLQRFAWDAKELGKEVDFDFKLNEEFHSLIQRAGFNTFLALNKKK
jgi:anti-anti-sigma regulatory factor